MRRQPQLDKLQQTDCFDLLILGGGINGACLYDTLCQHGYRVLLIDKGDFASGTSQSSGMMIWGGLLYLRNLDFRSVYELSYDRDYIARTKADWMSPQLMRYLPSNTFGRSKYWMQFGLWLYWLLGMGRRKTPRTEMQFKELSLIKQNFVNGSLAYEEVFLEQSDARFVYRWLAPHQQSGQMALNYCQIQDGAYKASNNYWQFDLRDILTGDIYPIRSRMVVNCAGIWTDQINRDFGITSPVRHAFSKGVYLGIPRAQEHETSLFFDLGEHGDVITLVPWGPIALWGPTETAITDLAEGMQVLREDIDYLLMHYNRRFSQAISREDIISLRCGVRPLVIDSHDQHGVAYPLDLSRRQQVVENKSQPWISCYGGKMTGCIRMAETVLRLLKQSIPATGTTSVRDVTWRESSIQTIFPGLSQTVPTAAWCAEHEQCYTLEDYLRRRTNIAQWIPRMGLGKKDCHAQVLKNAAEELAHGNAGLAKQLFDAYQEKVINNFDALLN